MDITTLNDTTANCQTNTDSDYEKATDDDLLNKLDQILDYLEHSSNTINI